MLSSSAFTVRFNGFKFYIPEKAISDCIIHLVQGKFLINYFVCWFYLTFNYKICGKVRFSVKCFVFVIYDKAMSAKAGAKSNLD